MMMTEISARKCITRHRFSDKNQQFSGEGLCPSPDPSPLGGDTPSLGGGYPPRPLPRRGLRPLDRPTPLTKGKGGSELLQLFSQKLSAAEPNANEGPS
jgi:hypothetical protein